MAEEIAVFGARARVADVGLIDGDAGLVIAPHGRLQLALTVRLTGDRIAGYDLIADPARLARLDLGVVS